MPSSSRKAEESSADKRSRNDGVDRNKVGTERGDSTQYKPMWEYPTRADPATYGPSVCHPVVPTTAPRAGSLEAKANGDGLPNVRIKPRCSASDISRPRRTTSPC